MEIEAVIEIQRQRDSFESRRERLVEKTQQTVETARKNVRALNGTTVVDGEKLPKFEETDWIIVKRFNEDVICGMIEVQNYTDDGMEHNFDGRVTVTFASAKIFDRSSTDNSLTTRNGELIDGESMRDIVYETTTANDILDVVTYVPPRNTPEHDAYGNALRNANSYLSSMGTSMALILEA